MGWGSLFVQLIGKKGEIHFAIGTMLPEMRMLFKGEISWVFKNKNAVFGEQLFFKDEVGQFWQIGQCVGWVGKDNVELLISSPD